MMIVLVFSLNATGEITGIILVSLISNKIFGFTNNGSLENFLSDLIF